jgi:hypothetical protein
MGASPPGAPYQGSALDPLETFGGPQTPRPDFLNTPGIRIFGTGADTLNSVQASYFESFHRPILNVWTLQTVEHDGNGKRNSMLHVCSVQKFKIDQ